MYLKQLFQCFNHFVTKFNGGGFPTQVGCSCAITPNALVIQNLADSSFNSLSFLFKSKGVPQEHRSAEDGSNRICDSLVSNVWRRTVDRFINA